jgi:hypothetical protein
MQSSKGPCINWQRHTTWKLAHDIPLERKLSIGTDMYISGTMPFPGAATAPHLQQSGGLELGKMGFRWQYEISKTKLPEI